MKGTAALLALVAACLGLSGTAAAAMLTALLLAPAATFADGDERNFWAEDNKPRASTPVQDASRRAQ